MIGEAPKPLLLSGNVISIDQKKDIDEKRTGKLEHSTGRSIVEDGRICF